MMLLLQGSALPTKVASQHKAELELTILIVWQPRQQELSNLTLVREREDKSHVTPEISALEVA